MAAKKVQKSLVTIHTTISGSFTDFQETIPEQVQPPSTLWRRAFRAAV